MPHATLLQTPSREGARRRVLGPGRVLRLAVLVCILATPATPATAREQLDLVLLANGDRVHGEIISLASATLVVRTLSLGTVEIDWPEVTGLQSPQLFEVELANGRRVVGQFSAYAPPGSLVLGGDAEELPPSPTPATDAPEPLPAPSAPAALPPADRTFELARVVAIRQRGATLWQSHRGYLDLGFNYAGAHDDSELAVGAEFTLRGPRMQWSNNLALSVRDDDNSRQRQRWQVQSLFEFPAGRRWLWAVSGLHQRNDDLHLDARESVYAAAFWVASRSAKGRLLLGGGAAESHERYRGESGADTVASGLVVVTGDFDRFGTHSTHASFTVAYLPVVDADGRYRIDAQAKFQQKIARNFTVSLSPYYTFDSRPPRQSLLEEDWGLTSSIGWLF